MQRYENIGIWESIPSAFLPDRQQVVAFVASQWKSESITMKKTLDSSRELGINYYICKYWGIVLLKSNDKVWKQKVMRIVVATDSYKGCLSSVQAGTAMAEGILKVVPHAEVDVLNVSDGGEGMAKAFAEATGASMVNVCVHDALRHHISASYAITSDGCAYIETAAASGLFLIREEDRNPMQASSYGTGEMIMHALHHGARRMVIGLGGSAMTDGGTGMLAACGVEFKNKEGCSFVPDGGTLCQIAHIDTSKMADLKRVQIIAACDVENVLYGPSGAACVFAPQKGATPEQVSILDEGLRHLATLQEQLYPATFASSPGAGAAGGLGFALFAFAGARMEPGIRLLLQEPVLTRRLRKADIILTGEGRLDSQSSKGKVPYGVLAFASRYNIPVAVIAGSIEKGIRAPEFLSLWQVTPTGMPLNMAMKPEVAKRNIRKTAESFAHTLEEKLEDTQ